MHTIEQAFVASTMIYRHFVISLFRY